jgi:hypothetical protein
VEKTRLFESLQRRDRSLHDGRHDQVRLQQGQLFEGRYSRCDGFHVLQKLDQARSFALTLLNIAVSARGRSARTNSRLIAGVNLHAVGVLHDGSSSDFHRSTKLPAR